MDFSITLSQNFIFWNGVLHLVTNQPKLYSSIQIRPTWSIFFCVENISCVQCINAQIKPKQSIFRSSFRKMCIVVHWHIQRLAVGMCCECLEKPVWKCNSVLKKCCSYSLANQTKMHSSIQIAPTIAVWEPCNTWEWSNIFYVGIVSCIQCINALSYPR